MDLLGGYIFVLEYDNSAECSQADLQISSYGLSVMEFIFTLWCSHSSTGRKNAHIVCLLYGNLLKKLQYLIA